MLRVNSQHAQQVARRHGGRGDVGDHIVFAFHFHKGAVFALHQIAHDARDAVEHHDQAHGAVGQHCVDAQGVQQRKHHRDQQIHDTGAAVIVMRGRKNAVDGFPVAHIGGCTRIPAEAFKRWLNQQAGVSEGA